MNETKLSTIEMETPRLRLREYSHNDFETFHEFLEEYDIAEIMNGLNLVNSRKYARDWLAGAYAQRILPRRSVIALGVEHPQEGLIGGCGLSFGGFYRDMNQASIGFFLHPDSRGKGYMGEALTHFLSYAFDETELRRVYGHVIEGNDASGKVLSRIGFFRGGVERDAYMTPFGQVKNLVHYDLLKKDFVSR